MDWKNRLYFGDNLNILRREVPDASVDLIYLDPPFNSNATYNVLFKEKSGEESAAICITRCKVDLLRVGLRGLLWYTDHDERRKTTAKTSRGQRAFACGH